MSATATEHGNPGFTLRGLLHGFIDPQSFPGSLDECRVTGIAIDSRRVVPGALFMAVPGVAADGRDHAEDALGAGACAVLYEARNAPRNCQRLEADGRAFGIGGLRRLVGPVASRFHGDPSMRLSITGITGTNGKTTCAWLMAQALGHLGERCALMGTIGAGFPGDLAPSSLTTGDAVSIQADLRHWLDAGASAVCMEVSSHGLDQGRVDGIRFDSAVFTNLSRDHLDYHGDMSNYAAAKKKLFRMPGLKCAVVNAEDPVGREILDECPAPTLISYGATAADISAGKTSFGDSGTRFTWRWQGREYDCESPLIGEINLANLLAVIATLVARGHDAATINATMSRVMPPPGRMERVSGSASGPAVIVDYAHTPDSLARALQSLRSLTRGALVVVFGCGGDRDAGKRKLMGRAAAQNADRIIITNDNPRSEDPGAIATMALEGVADSGASERCRIVLDRAQAIEGAIRAAADGDVVLIAGKGHETTQTIAGEVLPFNDREVASRVLEALH